MGRDVLVALSEGSGPVPGCAEHPAMELLKSLHRQDVDVRATIGPLDRVTDVRCFPRVELRSRLHVRRDEPLDFSFIKRSVPFCGVESVIFRRHDLLHPKVACDAWSSTTRRSFRDRALHAHRWPA